MRTVGGATRSWLPWLIAGFLSVLPLCVAAVIQVTFTTGLNYCPAYWPTVRSILTAATIPISAVLGYISQRVDFGFSIGRSFVLPAVAAFSLHTGFAGFGFGFDLFVPLALASPTVLFLAATVSLPVSLSVGGMMFAGSRVALLRAGGETPTMVPQAIMRKLGGKATDAVCSPQPRGPAPRRD
jgi:hypothetical protein